jgi:hypothetical protein
MPFVIRGGIAGYELAHTMALVMAGALVTSTLLNLFVVPVLYLRFGSSVVLEPEAEPAQELIADLMPHVDAPVPSGVAMKPPDVQPEPST